MLAIRFSLSVDNDTAAPHLFGNRLFRGMNLILSWCVCAPAAHERVGGPAHLLCGRIKDLNSWIDGGQMVNVVDV